jgi:nucleotide-binding universal stress UspA family protein
VSQQRPDLVIKQTRHAHPLRRWTLRGSDWQLVQDCPGPVMLAGARPWSQPLRIAAACDVADRDAEAVTRSILQIAGFLTLGSHGDLDILYSERERHDETLRMKRAVKLAQLVREFHVGSERIQLLTGKPEDTLPGTLGAGKHDLLVLGAVTHRAGIGAALSNLISKLADATDGDVLLVKAAESLREQIPDQCEQFV